MTATDLAGRLRELVEQWDSRHADWCCKKGCTWPGGAHITVDPVALVPTGTEPCPGACTCEVDNYVAPLRALLKEAAGADPA